MRTRANPTLHFGSTRALPFLVATLLAQSSLAVTELVTQIDPFSATPTAGHWYENDVRNAGAASIESLVGAGGTLEAGAPLPTGAALLTTTSDNADKAEIGVADDFGLAGDILNGDFELSYSYYKASSGNAFAAPSIKLIFFNFEQPCPSPDADCFVTLVYEPTWNQPGNEGASVAVPTGAWTDVDITNTSGLFWGSGGFGTPNTAGGPPLRTLDEWLTAFDATFQDATLVTVSVGVGTFNQDQIGYFDGVSLTTTGPSPVDVTYDFEVPSPAPGWFVDLYHSSQPASPVQAGYVGLDAADASDGSPVSVDGLSIGLASAGTEVNGTGVSGRDRGALDGSQPLSDLARDFAFAFGTDLVLTIDGLSAGTYEWTGYFHDRNLNQGEGEVSLSADGGATFAFGPRTVDHSTGANPPSIETQRIRFYTDGSSPVVVKISNPDLPTPSVRPILDGFDLLPSAPLSALNVDLYHASQGASPVQAGYTAVNAGDAADGTPVALGGLQLALASQGTEVGGTGVSGRDRGALDASQPLSNLARDFAFAFGEHLALTLTGVQPGTYVFTGYFHDRTVDQGNGSLRLSVDGGLSFAYGPEPIDFSTGANPPEIATQSIVFTTDGGAPVVVRVSNPNLPTPTVRPILDGFDLLQIDTTTRLIDFFDSTQGNSPVQAGFTGVDAVDASDGTPVEVAGLQISLESGGVEANGTGVSGRDRGPLDPSQAQSDLARDFAFAFGEDLLMTIEGLPAGPNVLIGYFHDSTVDQGTAEVSISVDGGATFAYGPTEIVASTGTDPESIGVKGFAFEANGVDPVVLKVSNPDLPNPSVRPILNGVRVIPEPEAWLSLAAGIGMLVALRRLRSR